MRSIFLVTSMLLLVACSKSDHRMEDTLVVGECPVPLELERNGELASFLPAPPDIKDSLSELFAGGDVVLDDLYIRPDRRMWLAISHDPGRVNLGNGDWLAFKARLRRLTAADLAPDVQTLALQALHDQGDRFLIISQGTGDNGRGVVEAVMGEAWDAATGCLVRLTLRSEDLESSSKIEEMFGGLQLHIRPEHS